MGFTLGTGSGNVVYSICDWSICPIADRYVIGRRVRPGTVGIPYGFIDETIWDFPSEQDRLFDLFDPIYSIGSGRFKL